MQVRYLNTPPKYAIIISQFTEEEKEDIIKTSKIHGISTLTMIGPGLITISCKNLKTYNWLLLKYLDNTNK